MGKKFKSFLKNVLVGFVFVVVISTIAVSLVEILGINITAQELFGGILEAFGYALVFAAAIMFLWALGSALTKEID